MLYIFDWDGTISDSASKIVECMQIAAEATGVEPLEDEVIRNIIGLAMPEAMQMLYPDLPEEKRRAVQQAYSQQFVSADVTPSPFFPGAMETLHQLRDKGFKVAVATGKSRRGLDRVLNNLDMQNFFHATRCADETESKPSPLMLRELLDEFAFKEHHAVMIGDTEYDMAMAQALNMPRIAVSYGAHSLDRLQAYDPDLCVDEFSQILQWQFEERVDDAV